MKKITKILSLTVVVASMMTPLALLANNSNGVNVEQEVNEVAGGSTVELNNANNEAEVNKQTINVNSTIDNDKAIGDIISSDNCTAEDSGQTTTSWMGITASFINFTVSKDYVSESNVGEVKITPVFGLDLMRLKGVNLTIPNYIVSNNEKYNVVEIGDNAFASAMRITGTLTISSSVTTIGTEAFSGCTDLTGTLTIPASVTFIGGFAFMSCAGLTKLDLSNATSLATIGDSAFYGCSGLTGTLTIPASVTSIGNFAFGLDSNFTSIEVDKANPKYALASSKSVGAASVVIDKEQYPDLNYDYTTNLVGDLACGELTVWNDPSVSSINSLFVGSGISKVIIGDNITEIQTSFNHCLNLTALDLSNALNLTTISINPSVNFSCFVNCPKLTGELIIPAKLKQIQIGQLSQPAFSNSAFKKLIFKGSPSNNIDYEQLFKATINQTTDFTIEVPLADRDAYIAKFPNVSSENIKGV